MTPIEYVIPVLGLLLEVLILGRGYRAHLWRRYPFFYVYMGYVFIHTVALFAITLFSFSVYAMAYWIPVAVAVLLRFFVIWEVFRQTFSSVLVVRRLVGQVLSILLMGLTTALFFGSNSPGLFFSDLERKAGFVQAAMLMVTFLLARYYVVSLGRNMLGMALGLGMYVSVAVMNFAALELVKSFFPYWRFIVPLSFVGMMSVWTCPGL